MNNKPVFADARSVLGKFSELGVQIRGVADDSRRVRPGDLFLAFPGDRADGRAFIADAIKRGACGVLWQAGDDFAWNDAWQVPNLGAPSLRPLCGPLAHAVFGNPSERLSLIAITGTNGKTSISQWLARIHPHRCAPCWRR